MSSKKEVDPFIISYIAAETVASSPPPSPFRSLSTIHEAELGLLANKGNFQQEFTFPVERQNIHHVDDIERPCAPVCIGFFDLVLNTLYLFYHFLVFVTGSLALGTLGICVAGFGIRASWKLIQSRDMLKPVGERRQMAQYWKWYSIFLLFLHGLCFALVLFLVVVTKEHREPQLIPVLVCVIIFSCMRVVFLFSISQYIKLHLM